MGKLLKVIKNPKKIIDFLAYHKCFNWLSDKQYLKLMYWTYIGKKLNLENPKTFNEKLQWLKLNDRKDIYTTMVDKYEVKKYVADRIGEEYIIPTLGVWDNFDDIDFEKLPNQFVLKCTHDSGGLVICKDKSEFDINSAKKKINRCLKTNYYKSCREWPYKNVRPRIIAEEFLDNISSVDLEDYKLMCFNGKVKCSFVCSERFSDLGLRVTFYDQDWNVMPFERHYPKSDNPIPKPQGYDEMVNLAEILSNNTLFSRIDLYYVNQRVYFGEITLFPGSGFEEFTPEEWDAELGNWINLPTSRGVNSNPIYDCSFLLYEEAA